jgi:hypothetical protein
MGGECSMHGAKHAYAILVGKPEGKRPLGELGIGKRIISEWILVRWDEVVWTGWIWLRIGTSGGLL